MVVPEFETCCAAWNWYGNGFCFQCMGKEDWKYVFEVRKVKKLFFHCSEQAVRKVLTCPVYFFN